MAPGSGVVWAQVVGWRSVYFQRPLVSHGVGDVLIPGISLAIPHHRPHVMEANPCIQCNQALDLTPTGAPVMNLLSKRQEMVLLSEASDAFQALGADIERELATGDAPNSVVEKTGFCRRILIESSKLSLLPTLSPLSLGHCVVFSREYVNNISSLILKYPGSENEITAMINNHQVVFGESILFEHGMSPFFDSLACGVTRAHFHLFPDQELDFLRLINDISGDLGEYSAYNPWPHIQYSNHEYLAIHSNRYGSYIWHRTNIPSQIVRKYICIQQGRDVWDWKKMFGWKDMTATMLTWKQAATIP
ncbi:hypothetical protein [Methylobacterium nonmethylotrophicum]|uniref:Uncharacterized protein n=1 Tax=Methylobacterium nonmethylotrophicum TaxID=1141884 RepID=A0A4Z0NSY5_9HYPH|nr:hypothetical protein [Methylobacterium nonmethylotrophicum]TGD99257.1 hypothetical protein EU555_12025 [Methylobacterium nonmethylotrophicum]